MRRSWMIGAILGALATTTAAQSWNAAYDEALTSARAGSWLKSREAFRKAAAYRTDDVSGTTYLPGPATERKKWRNGAPYSPNFCAAYASYRLGMAATEPQQRAEHLNLAAREFESALSRSQLSYESFYFLNATYSALGNTAKKLELDQRFSAATGKVDWKVDTEIVAPEELAMIAQTLGSPSSSNPQPVGKTDAPTGVGTAPSAAPPLGTRVPPIATKYALIVGNSESRIQGLELPFASDDAQMIREALLTNAGYLPENVDVVINATGAQLLSSARALVDRLPDVASVFVFFAGAGVNINGVDWLAGVDSADVSDVSSMVSKSQLYGLFSSKGARVFAFFEANRPISGGRFFGMDVPLVGAIAQSQGTMPGERVFGLVRNGKTVGAYASALASVLMDFRSNRIPILEYGWQVFYSIRSGGTGSQGGSSRQTPTLPVLTNMASDARF